MKRCVSVRLNHQEKTGASHQIRDRQRLKGRIKKKIQVAVADYPKKVMFIFFKISLKSFSPLFDLKRCFLSADMLSCASCIWQGE